MIQSTQSRVYMGSPARTVTMIQSTQSRVCMETLHGQWQWFKARKAVYAWKPCTDSDNDSKHAKPCMHGNPARTVTMIQSTQSRVCMETLHGQWQWFKARKAVYAWKPCTDSDNDAKPCMHGNPARTVTVQTRFMKPSRSSETLHQLKYSKTWPV